MFHPAIEEDSMREPDTFTKVALADRTGGLPSAKTSLHSIAAMTLF